MNSMENNNQSELKVDNQAKELVLFKRQKRRIWKIRTKLLYFWIILLFGLIITLIILHFFPILTNTSGKELSDICLVVCTTRACIKAASQILKHIDQTVSPCDDFYKFACGKWLEDTVIPEDNNMISSFSVTQDMIDHRLKQLVEMPSVATDSQTIKNMKTMYYSCINSTKIENDGSEPLLMYLKLFGGWPVIEGDNWNKSNFDWIETIGKMRKLGFKHQFFLHIRVAPNLKKNTIHNIYLTEPTFGLIGRKELKEGLESLKVRHYLDFMIDIAVLLGADKNRSKIELQNVIRLESLIANAPQNKDRFSSLTIKELEGVASNTNWIKLVNNVLSLNNTIDETETIIVQSLEAVQALDALFGSYQRKNERTLANFIIWRIISQSLWTMDKRFTELEEQFSGLIRPQRRSLKRWKMCLNQITATMIAGTASLFVTNEQSKDKSRYLANQMFNDIQSVLINKFDEIDWIDEETRSNAQRKAKAMNRFIGYSDHLLNTTIIDGLYETMQKLENDSLFMNVLKLRKWSFDNEYSKLLRFNDRNDWRQSLTLAAVNAYYSPYINSIKIPIWILNGVFFDVDRPQYLNYGALGWVISHEAIHGFDNTGGRFDKRGNMRDWWDIESKEIFNNKTQCLVEQYSKYNLSYDLNINGESTLSENIADNGGITLAFRAYLEFVKRNGEELPMAGLEYSPQQLFWISSANIWCSKHTPEGYKNFVMNSIHSLSEYRVFVSFANSKEFSNAFRCKEGQPMNPKHKCKVW